MQASAESPPPPVAGGKRVPLASSYSVIMKQKKQYLEHIFKACTLDYLLPLYPGSDKVALGDYRDVRTVDILDWVRHFCTNKAGSYELGNQKEKNWKSRFSRQHLPDPILCR